MKFTNETILNMTTRRDWCLWPKRPVTALLCIRHVSYWWTEPMHVKQRWGTVPRVHYHSRLTWHCFSEAWLPGPLQLEVNRQFSISRERGFISKNRGVEVRGVEVTEKSEIKFALWLQLLLMYNGNKVWADRILKFIMIAPSIVLNVFLNKASTGSIETAAKLNTPWRKIYSKQARGYLSKQYCKKMSRSFWQVKKHPPE